MASPFESARKLESKEIAEKLDFECHSQKSKQKITSDFYNPLTPNNFCQMGFEAADCDPCESTYLSNNQFKPTPAFGEESDQKE